LDAIDDPYALAIATYALELNESASAQVAYDRLMDAAEEDEDGLHWGGGEPDLLMPFEQRNEPALSHVPVVHSSDIEATGYAVLALIQHGDQVNASRAARWLVSQRNAYGGFGSTQDTVVGLQALTEFAALASADVDLTVAISAGDTTEEVLITSDNFDVMQVIEVPTGVQMRVEAEGEGQAVLQVVRRYNLPEPEEGFPVFDISIDYDTTQVDVNDIVGVDVSVTFNPPEIVKAGMVVLDVSVPTGFTHVSDTLDALVESEPKIKRYDVAGRKVILYIDDMAAGETISFSFEVQALFPVRGKGTASEAYSYYNPEWKGETIGEGLTVSDD
jgi:CD109 antigen